MLFVKDLQGSDGPLVGLLEGPVSLGEQIELEGIEGRPEVGQGHFKVLKNKRGLG